MQRIKKTISPMKVLSRFPKERQPLPEAYQKIYNDHYASNRKGGTTASYFSSKLEEWMHKKVAADTIGRDELVTLEIGAGTLNQLQFESTKTYDIVEPFRLLYESSVYLERIRNVYADVSEIEGQEKYDRITTIAAFEHICNLPDVVASCRRLLKPKGCLRVAIPNEGRFLWKFAYEMTTGLEFRQKYRLPYSTLMNYEHVNTADEIEAILAHYFPVVKMSLFGISRDFAFYRYYECLTE